MNEEFPQTLSDREDQTFSLRGQKKAKNAILFGFSMVDSNIPSFGKIEEPIQSNQNYRLNHRLNVFRWLETKKTTLMRENTLGYMKSKRVSSELRPIPPIPPPLSFHRCKTCETLRRLEPFSSTPHSPQTSLNYFSLSYPN